MSYERHNHTKIRSGLESKVATNRHQRGNFPLRQGLLKTKRRKMTQIKLFQVYAKARMYCTLFLQLTDIDTYSFVLYKSYDWVDEMPKISPMSFISGGWRCPPCGFDGVIKEVNDDDKDEGDLFVPLLLLLEQTSRRSRRRPRNVHHHFQS